MMKMKRSFISGCLAAAALLLSGCVGGLQTQRIPVNIGFDPVIGHDTRAEESVPFPEDRTFNVWAVNESNGSLYLDDETVSHSSGGWLASRKWPLAELTFEAYSPSDLTPTFSRNKGLTISDFDCSEGDVDILIAQADNADMDIDSLVTITFEHVLSRVEFRMLHSLSSEMSVKVKKIELIGFASKGTYNSRNDHPWDIGESDFSYVVFEDEAGLVITSEPIYLGSDFYTIPQRCTAQVEVSFEVKYGNASWIPQVETIDAINTSWEPSTHYTYTLNLTETKLTHTTGISTWSNRNE